MQYRGLDIDSSLGLLDEAYHRYRVESLLPGDQPMPFSMNAFRRNYDTELFPVKVGTRHLTFFKPKSIDRFINPDNPMEGFPLWAKIWEASAILLQYMADLDVDPQRRILELGSGIGVAGIAAASMGHNITLTEYDPDALNFLKANADLNNCPHARVRHLDWFSPDLEGRYDLMIGSEIIYQKQAVTALGDVFKKFLSPRGMVVLAERVRSTGAVFFEKMATEYDVKAQKCTLTSSATSETVMLFKLRSL
jgi:protein-L-isoaspartate O-methyltransferase